MRPEGNADVGSDRIHVGDVEGLDDWSRVGCDEEYITGRNVSEGTAVAFLEGWHVEGRDCSNEGDKDGRVEIGRILGYKEGIQGR